MRAAWNSGLRAVLNDHVAIDALEEAAIPLHVIAVDLYSGEEVRLSEGPAIDAIAASAAIPGVFPPVSWGATDLIDGGVANNTPISHAVELGAEEIYVLPAGRACALEEPPRGALGMTLHAMTLLIQRRLEADVEAFRDRVRLHVLPPPCPLAVQPVDFGRADLLIDRSLADARAFLASREPRKPPARARRPRSVRRRRAPRAARAA